MHHLPGKVFSPFPVRNMQLTPTFWGALAAAGAETGGVVPVMAVKACDHAEQDGRRNGQRP